MKIRCEVADNPDTPGPVLAKLAFDMEEEVRRRALKNEKTAPALLKQFAREYPLGYALMMTDILYDWLKVSE